jgi:hypothetical protein
MGLNTAPSDQIWTLCYWIAFLIVDLICAMQNSEFPLLGLCFLTTQKPHKITLKYPKLLHGHSIPQEKLNAIRFFANFLFWEVRLRRHVLYMEKKVRQSISEDLNLHFARRLQHQLHDERSLLTIPLFGLIATTLPYQE